MGSMKFNDLWTILQNMDDSLTGLLPEKFIDFVKRSVVPGAGSSVDTGVPLEDQELSPETRDFLAALYLTYWAESAQKRREFAGILHRNEQKWTGQPESSMTEEDYQALLEPFDYWNEDFGPVPFWAESRNWCPKAVYEIAGEGEEAELTSGDVRLKEVYASPEQRERILEEAKQWVLIADSDCKEVLYWHDDDTEVWHETKRTEDF